MLITSLTKQSSMTTKQKFLSSKYLEEMWLWPYPKEISEVWTGERRRKDMQMQQWWLQNKLAKDWMWTINMLIRAWIIHFQIIQLCWKILKRANTWYSRRWSGLMLKSTLQPSAYTLSQEWHWKRLQKSILKIFFTKCFSTMLETIKKTSKWSDRNLTNGPVQIYWLKNAVLDTCLSMWTKALTVKLVLRLTKGKNYNNFSEYNDIRLELLPPYKDKGVFKLTV